MLGGKFLLLLFYSVQGRSCPLFPPLQLCPKPASISRRMHFERNPRTMDRKVEENSSCKIVVHYFIGECEAKGLHDEYLAPDKYIPHYG